MSGVLIMAGGTGGHVFPALAVAQKLQDKNVQVTWLGTRRGLEASVVPANQIDIEWISIEGLRGKGVLTWLLAPIKLIRAMWQSFQAINRIRPECILGMGGFVAGPGGLVGKLMGKPLIVHEQNAVAGLTNKYLAKIANHVLTGFPNVIDLPIEAQWVGNPVRSSIHPAQKQENPQDADSVINVLVIGGSQGAHSFNKYLPQLLMQYASQINIWHQTGKGSNADVETVYSEVTSHLKTINLANFKVTEFIEDMAAAYEWADLLICRAGAMTVAECCAAAKPALLVPYPFSAGDHQDANAMTMVKQGAGVMVANSDLTTGVFTQALESLLNSRETLYEMGRKAYELHKPDAVQQVVKVCEGYCHA